VTFNWESAAYNMQEKLVDRLGVARTGEMHRATLGLGGRPAYDGVVYPSCFRAHHMSSIASFGWAGFVFQGALSAECRIGYFQSLDKAKEEVEKEKLARMAEAALRKMKGPEDG